MYVDARFDRDRDRVLVAERVNGQRVMQEHPAEYVFYLDDPRGKHETIYGTRVTEFKTRSYQEFQKEIRINSNKKLWEHDINPINRCLSRHYLGQNSPEWHVAYLDIEVSFSQDRGYSDPSDPFNPITAITVYLDWLDRLVTLSVPPENCDPAVISAAESAFSDCFILKTEKELIDTFLDLIADADVVSGWNSEGYDLPYIVMRTQRILSKNDTRRLCLWDQFPRSREFERYGKTQLTFDLVGRVHLDYLQLYRKYTYHEMHSYSLDAVSEYELGEHKVAYEGSLDQLYSQDYVKFLDYNRQDVMLIKKLDTKLKLLDLVNELAHENTVLLSATMGSVAMIEQAIINEAHAQNLIVPSRTKKPDNPGAAGAYVAYPKKGMHDWIGAIDINSLYPSVIRALNMGPETIVGQLRQTLTQEYIDNKVASGESFAGAWENMFGTLEYQLVLDQDRAREIIIDWESGESTSHSGAEVYQLIFDSNQKWCLSANGTIFRTDKKGLIPGLLERWYAERKDLQAKKKTAADVKEKEFWDKRQLIKKILLNSLYGALLNQGCRFEDIRMGQSTTLSGRQIVKHMNAYINQCITGEYDHVGQAAIYSDTDSALFSIWPIIKSDVESGKMVWNKETCTEIYDAISDQVNNSFPGFMSQAFHCSPEHGKIIRGGRELVASKGIFVTKKRYAVLIYDLEGARYDVDGKSGKVKAMGLDLKRADTPKFVQDFLLDLLTRVLEGADQEYAAQRVREFKKEFAARPAWEKGTPKRVNKLTQYSEAEKKQGRANMPGHVRASLNWNTLRRMNSDRRSLEITDGMKVIVCKLRDNMLGYTSVAYPIDQLHLPKWFLELPFDHSAMETSVVDKKIDNLLGVLEWRFDNTEQTNSAFNSLFEFE
jgi:DNA polymerase elongation subunit (family B)